MVVSLVGKTINHAGFIKEICGTAATKTTRGIMGRQLDDVVSQFHRTYIKDPEHLTEDTVMERILHDLHYQKGYRTSSFQQRCFAVFIKMCAPLIFSHSRNDAAQYARLLRKYGIEKTNRRLALIETSRRMGKSHSLKIHCCAMTKNLPGLRTMYISKDEYTCKQDYKETIDFALKIGANISCADEQITFKHDDGRTSYIIFKSGHSPNVSSIYLFVVCCLFFFCSCCCHQGEAFFFFGERERKASPPFIFQSINQYVILTFLHAIAS